MFPVTLNGNTYNEADFQGSDTARNFGRFAYDLMQDRSNPYSSGNLIATSATSNSYSTGAKTFTVTAGKGFKKGMPVVVQRVGDSALSAMYGYVSDYVGTTLSVTIDAVNAPDATASTSWIISNSMPVTALSGTASKSDGGSGETTALAAWESLFLPKYNKRPEVMNDMEGGVLNYAETNPYFGNPVVANRMLLLSANGGRVRNNVEAEAYAAGVPDLHKHPGIVELSVKNYHSCAMLLGGDNGFVNAVSSSGVLFEAAIYIPEITGPGDEEQFGLWFGGIAGVDITTSLAFVNIISAIPTNPITPLSSMIVAALNQDDSGEGTLYSEGNTVALNWTGVPGWFTISVYANGGNTSAAVNRDNEANSSVASTASPSSVNVELMTPVVMLYKKRGGLKSFKVYVDYWYVGPGVGNTAALSRL